jgi:hypothetical protein
LIEAIILQSNGKDAGLDIQVVILRAFPYIGSMMGEMTWSVGRRTEKRAGIMIEGQVNCRKSLCRVAHLYMHSYQELFFRDS